MEQGRNVLAHRHQTSVTDDTNVDPRAARAILDGRPQELTGPCPSQTAFHDAQCDEIDENQQTGSLAAAAAGQQEVALGMHPTQGAAPPSYLPVAATSPRQLAVVSGVVPAKAHPTTRPQAAATPSWPPAPPPRSAGRQSQTTPPPKNLKIDKK